jgi:hypothetical protein
MGIKAIKIFKNFQVLFSKRMFLVFPSISSVTQKDLKNKSFCEVEGD